MQQELNGGPSNQGQAQNDLPPKYEVPDTASTAGGSTAAPRDPKAQYALTLQQACDSALQRMKSNEIIANSGWAAPLAAAPLAISTMAILFKAADMKAAAGLEVESRDVMEDGKAVGQLP